MKAVTMSALKAKMKSYFDSVSKSFEVIIVPRNNNDEDAIVIMSIQKYNALKETGDLLSTESNQRRLQESIEQMKSGDTVPFL